MVAQLWRENKVEIERKEKKKRMGGGKVRTGENSSHTFLCSRPPSVCASPFLIIDALCVCVYVRMSVFCIIALSHGLT